MLNLNTEKKFMNKILQLFSISFLLLFLTSYDSDGQERFKAGVFGGLNASQILLDDVGGYNRLGIQGGLRAIAVLTKRTDVFFEILYSQRGSRDSQGHPFCYDGPLDISANYIEVPVMVTIKDWLSDNSNFYRIQASGGLSYGRLINASSEGSCHDDLADLFNKNDISFTVGAEYFTNEHLTIGMRWSRSLNLLYNRKEGDKIGRNENSLRGFFLSFRAGYIF